MQKNNAILELFYKSLDCIDTSIINDDRIKNLIISEYGKFALAYLGVNLSYRQLQKRLRYYVTKCKIEQLPAILK